MAMIFYCDFCQKETSHTVQMGCLKCREREEKEYKDRWMKQSYEDQISDLYDRVKDLEKRHHFPTLG